MNMNDKPIAFREFVAVALLTYFGILLLCNVNDAEMKGATITAFAAAWGYYLGGSKIGSDTAARNAEAVAKQAETPATTKETLP